MFKGKVQEEDPRIDRAAVYTPDKGKMLYIRGDIQGRTTQWAYQMSASGIWVPGQAWTMQLTGRIVGSSFAGGVDDRIEQQRKSIDIMLDHLKAHCPKLMGTGDCPHITKPEGVVA